MAGPDTLTMESLFPHALSIDTSHHCHTDSESGEEQMLSSQGLFAVLEHVPLVSSGLQVMHGYFGNESALQRARQADPIGPNGFITHAAEHVPIVNSVVQAVYKAGDDSEALERARSRDPIGSHGYLTKVFEHIPLVSDGMVAIHKYHGEDLAAERARGYSLAKLLSKDGAITRVAELVPGSNLVAVLGHYMNGDKERAARAMNLVDSWSSLDDPNSGLWQVAELFPGADAVAFAVHLQSGHYAQALRSVTKTSYVNVMITEMTFFIHCPAASETCCCEVEIHEVDVLPRQLSLVVGLSDLVTNFLREDWEGHLRDIRDPEALAPAPQMTAMDLSKELVKAVVDDFVALKIHYLISNVPTYLDWLVEYLSTDLLPRYRQESLSWRALAPGKLPTPSEEEKEEVRQTCPTLTVRHRPLDAPDPIRLKPRPLSGACGCLSLTAVAAACGLGTKVGAAACLGAAAAGAADLARSAVRYAVGCVSADNARRWRTAVVEPQPDFGATSPGACASQSSSPAGSDPPSQPIDAPPAESSGVVLEIPRGEVDRLNPFACDYVRRSMFPSSATSSLCACLEPFTRKWLISTVSEAVESPVPLVLEVDLDPWQVPLEGYNFDLQMPSMRFALVVHVDISDKRARFVRAFCAFPTELIDNIARCLQDQIRQWDVREMDPRFDGFTQPAHVDLELQASWGAPSLLRLTARNLSCRLDLPAA